MKALIDNNQVVNLFNQGKSVKEIMGEMGLKYKQPVYRVLNQTGLKYKTTLGSRKEFLSRDNINKIISLRKEGLAVDKIGELFGKHHQYITNILKREKEYTRKELVPFRKYTINHDYFKVIDTQEKAYIIGFICADGHIDRKRGRINISLSVKDIDILSKIHKELGSDGLIKFYNSENPYKKGKDMCEMCKIGLNSRELVESLHFIPENKTYNLTSNVIRNIPDNLIRHFLRGYFDGDGNVMWGKRYDSGIKYNINICGNEEFLINTFNRYFPSYNKMYKDKYSKQCYVWKISSKERVKSFLNYLYSDTKIYLDRKYKTFELSQCAHIKPIELLETQTDKAVGNQQPSLNDKEGSETIERLTIAS